MTAAVLETERLILRPWRPADRVPFAALNADPEVMACFPAPLAREESDALAERVATLIAQRGWGVWALERKEDGCFIGFTGLHEPSDQLPFSPCVEVAWRLARAAWGQGLACEAARAALSWGFEHLELAEIVAFTALGNRRSRALMERLGFSNRGEDFDHPLLPTHSPLLRHCLYRLGRTEWFAQSLHPHRAEP